MHEPWTPAPLTQRRLSEISTQRSCQNVNMAWAGNSLEKKEAAENDDISVSDPTPPIAEKSSSQSAQ